jgi:hypothetical protein
MTLFTNCQIAAPSKPYDPFDGFQLQPPGEWKPPVPGSRPTTPTPPPSESPEPVMLGPYPRLFVIHDGGHGYEILPEETYQLYTIAKSHDRECTKVDELFVKLEENVVFHTFVTVERNGNLPPLTFLKEEEKTETSFPVSPALLTRRVSQFARCFQAKQRNSKLQTRTKCDWLQLDFMLPNLPRIINPVLPKLEAVVNESSFVYRQVCEHPFINEETNGHIDKILEAYAEWQLENLQLQRIEKIVDNRDDDMIAMEKEIACRIREVSQKIMGVTGVSLAFDSPSCSSQIHSILCMHKLQCLESFQPVATTSEL